MYHAVGDDGADAFAGGHGIDMGAHEKRRSLSREERYDAAGLVYTDIAAKRLKVRRGAGGHRRLVSAFAVNRDVFKKIFQETFFVYHLFILFHLSLDFTL